MIIFVPNMISVLFIRVLIIINCGSRSHKTTPAKIKLGEIYITGIGRDDNGYQMRKDVDCQSNCKQMKVNNGWTTKPNTDRASES